MRIYDAKPDVHSYTRNLTVDIFYTSAQDTIRHNETRSDSQVSSSDTTYSVTSYDT